MLKWIEEMGCTQAILAKRCSQNKIGRLLLWCGTRLFGYMVTWTPPGEKNVKAMHFAISEADMNSSARTYVDELDEGYKR